MFTNKTKEDTTSFRLGLKTMVTQLNLCMYKSWKFPPQKKKNTCFIRVPVVLKSPQPLLPKSTFSTCIRSLYKGQIMIRSNFPFDEPNWDPYKFWLICYDYIPHFWELSNSTATFHPFRGKQILKKLVTLQLTITSQPSKMYSLLITCLTLFGKNYCKAPRHLRDALPCSPKLKKKQTQFTTPDNSMSLHVQSFLQIASSGTSSELDHTSVPYTDNIICFIIQHTELATLWASS